MPATGVAHGRRVVRLGAGSGSASGRPQPLVHDVQLAFAHSTQTVFYIMAGVMAATFLVTVRWSPRGRTESVNESEELAGHRPARRGRQLAARLVDAPWLSPRMEARAAQDAGTTR